jgi:hypothetical protein
VSFTSAIAALVLLAAVCGPAAAGESSQVYKVGLKQVEFTDPNDNARRLALAVFYPAVPGADAAPIELPFFTSLQLYRDAEVAPGKYPLVMFSHGRGSNPLYYAWFAELLASHGYVVAGPYHYRANTYDSTIAYLASKLWQRPKDISLAIDFLLGDTASPSIRTGSALRVILKAASRRFGLAAPRSTPTSTSPSNGAGATISRCLHICASSCRSIRRRRSTSETRASKR